MPKALRRLQANTERVPLHVPPSAQSAANQHALPSPDSLLTLFGRLGNQTVQRMLANQTPTPHAALLQRKLQVGAANDHFEAEADEVAQNVIQGMTQRTDPVPAPAASQRQPEDQGLPAPQVGEQGGEVNHDLAQRIHSASRNGKQVPPTIRRAVEERTGAALGDVRYHDDKQAHTISAALGAKAATHQNHIFLGAGESPHDLQLMAHELTHTVQQGAPAIQRFFGKKKKKPATTHQEMFDTGKAPQNAFFTVTAAVKMSTETRGSDSLKSLLAGGAGHSWLDIRLGPAFPTLDALLDDDDGYMIGSAMEDSTKQQLAANRHTTVGFYPQVGANAFKPSALAKQIVSGFPGYLLEPEQPHFAGNERGGQTFPVTDVDRAIDLFSFIRSRRAHSYNVYRYNCTDFVNDAIQRLGYSMGKTSHSLGITLPTLLYKQIYSRAELGDRSARYTKLKNERTGDGRRYDVKHLGKKAQKKLTKQKAKVAPMLRARHHKELWDKAIQTITVYSYLTLTNGGMLRPGTQIGLTGNLTSLGHGEIILGDSIDYVDLKEFKTALGFPYPGSEKFQQSEDEDSYADDVRGNEEEVPQQEQQQGQGQGQGYDQPIVNSPQPTGVGQQQDEEKISDDAIKILNELDLDDLEEFEEDIEEQDVEIVYL